jgi:hypothetical protein
VLLCQIHEILASVALDSSRLDIVQLVERPGELGSLGRVNSRKKGGGELAGDESNDKPAGQQRRRQQGVASGGADRHTSNLDSRIHDVSRVQVVAPTRPQDQQ